MKAKAAFILLLASAFSAVYAVQKEANRREPPAKCPSVCDCPSPDKVDCSSRRLGEISPGLLVFPGSRNVKELSLKGNSLTEVPANAFTGMPNLEKLDLSGNAIKLLSDKAFQKLASLQELDLSFNKLEMVPGIALRLVKNSLANLALDHNGISRISDNAFQSTPGLTELNIAGNSISELSPKAFADLGRLKNLTLTGNQLSSLHMETFQHLPSLSKLDLSSNRLDAIPEGISYLTQLEKLFLSDNHISKIPEGLLQKCQNLQQIGLRGNKIKEVHPDAFMQLPNLKKLTISEARLVTQFPNLNGTTSLEFIRFDRAQISKVPHSICRQCPKLRSLELKSNVIEVMPDLAGCKELRVLDLAWNKMTSFGQSPFSDLESLHDLLLAHNNFTAIDKDTFKGLNNLLTLDLSSNLIANINEEAFGHTPNLRDINLGVNVFDKFPTKGLKNLVEIKTHNNPNLVEFPTSNHFPNVQNLVLSYAYHCCNFMPSTYTAFLPEYEDDYSISPGLKEGIYLPDDFKQNFSSNVFWTQGNSNLSAEEIWENVGTNTFRMPADYSDIDVTGLNPVATPRPGIQCMPAPGPFLPCNDLFDWWTLRCSVWIVFLLALLGNGCVVIVLVASRSKMDVPRFLVCNLAMADFCMGLYLGFLAIVDAATIGDFRKFAIPWQFSAGCQAAGFLGVLSSELSVFTLAVITLERNYAITHAMHLNKRLSLKHASYIMMAGWTFALIMATMPLIGISDYRKFAVCLPFETGDGLSLGFVIFLMLINGVAFSILMGCYLKMYCAIRGSQAWNSNDSRIAKRMALLVFTDFICWAPIAFFSITAASGLQLISLEQAKVFTIFILPLNSCCNPFLYAILTKQFKKDCVMICKAIEESRVTRGIGRCRHSSNFSNRQTPANTNSLNSGSGSHGSHSRGTICSCNTAKKPPVFTIRWPFNKLKEIFLGVKDASGLESGAGIRSHQLMTASEYTHHLAEIQNKQGKTKRHPSMSSDNFSSSRSDSWRHGGLPTRPGHRHHHHHHHHHRRRNSWTVTRKPSQDSQMSSSRNDSASSNSTNTWRISRSSMSSDTNNSMARTGSAYSTKSGLGSHGRSNELARMATENSAMMAKPKLIRQTAILADGDSTGSGKSVTFQEPAGIGSARRFVAAATELGTCPLHSHQRYRALYDKLVETAAAQAEEEEESDMEASDAEEDEHANSESLPLGTTFRTLHLVPAPAPAPVQAQAGPSLSMANHGRTAFIPRKLSTISSQDRESIPNIEEDEDGEVFEAAKPAEVAEAAEATTSVEVHSKSEPPVPVPVSDPEREKLVKVKTTDFEWHPDDKEDEEPQETSALLEKDESDSKINDANSQTTSETKNLPPVRTASRYRNTDV